MVSKRRSTKSLFVTLVLLLLAAGVIAGLELSGTTHFFHKPVVSKPSSPITSLPKPSGSNPNPSQQQPATGSGADQQGDVDKQGQAPKSGVSNDPSTWTTSASGLIIVKTPTIGATFKPGDELYGSAKVDRIQYRLVDSQAGVISQGFISVVNGNFAASVNFKPLGKTGRLDVFSTDATGKEMNEVQISVNF